MPVQNISTPYCYASQVSTGSNYITVSWNFPSGADVGQAKIYDYDTGALLVDSGILPRYQTSYTYYVSNPQWNIYGKYACTCKALNYNTGDYSAWSDSTYGFTRVTLSKVVYYPVSKPTNISVSYSGMIATITWTKDPNATYTDVWNTSDGTHGTPTDSTWNFTVPQKGVTYNFKLASANPDYSSDWTDPIPIYIAARPTNFIGNLYKTAIDGNDVIDTAQWHAFATKINEFRAYKGLSQYTYVYLSNAQNGSDFLAIYFNEMLNSMSFCSGLPSNKNAGDNILKSYFDTMVTSLNNIV